MVEKSQYVFAIIDCNLHHLKKALVDMTKVKHIKSFVANLYNGLQDLSSAICIESKSNLSQSKHAKNELDGSPFSSQQSHRMHFL